MMAASMWQAPLSDWNANITTYRVTVAVLGRCGLPTVGMPLLRPWPSDEALRVSVVGRLPADVDEN